MRLLGRSLVRVRASNVQVSCRPLTTSRPHISRPTEARRLHSSTPSTGLSGDGDDSSGKGSAAARSECLKLLARNSEVPDEEARVEYGWIVAHLRDELGSAGRFGKETEVDHEMVKAHCARRGAGEPLQYILGSVDFGPLTFLTRPPIFIPRPETAYVIERLVERINTTNLKTAVPLRILDICTGSGSLALLLAHHFRHRAHVTGIDINPDAVALATENANFNDLEAYVQFQKQDVFDLTRLEDYDMIVSNPPYIPRGEWDELSKSVKDYEDPRALIGDPGDLPATAVEEHGLVVQGRGDGLGQDFYRRIASLLPSLENGRRSRSTAPGLPLVAVEIGPTQAEDVSKIFQSQSRGVVGSTEVWQDQFGKDRMVVAFAR